MRFMTALFDFDGVVMDTEPQYTLFWNRIGEQYVGNPDFGASVKGQTLKNIFAKYFSDREDMRRLIADSINTFEKQMSYIPVPGAFEFIRDLRGHGIKTAVVTSSDNLKMDNVYRHYPDLKALVGPIYTSEHFTRSKPDPECFLVAMRELGGTPSGTVIFEDSISGLEAARASGAVVVGLSTTNPPEVVSRYADKVIPDFRGVAVDDIASLLPS